jgi:hypothetical protein
MNTNSNFIIFSGPSGVGKSVHMEHLSQELKQHGYTVDNSLRFYVDTPDWKTEIFEQAEKRCESRFCLIEVCTADQSAGMEINFRDSLGAMDLLNAKEGIADLALLGCDRDAPM